MSRTNRQSEALACAEPRSTRCCILFSRRSGRRTFNNTRSRKESAAPGKRDPVKPATDASLLPEHAGLLLHVRGADRLLRGYAALPSKRLRGGALNAVLAPQPTDHAQ